MELLLGLFAVGVAGCVAYWKPVREYGRKVLADAQLNKPDGPLERARSAAAQGLGPGFGSGVGSGLGSAFGKPRLWERFSAGMTEDEVRRLLLGRVDTCSDGSQQGLRGEGIRIENHLAVPSYWFTAGRLDRIALDFPASGAPAGVARNESVADKAFTAAPDDAQAVLLARLTSMLNTRYGSAGQPPSRGAGQATAGSLQTWRHSGKVIELSARPSAAAQDSTEPGTMARISYMRDGSSAL